MNIFTVIGLSLTGTVLAIVLRQYRPEYRLFISLATGICILLLLAQAIEPMLTTLQSMLSMASMPQEYLEVLLKALGISFVCQLTSDVCSDAGESAIGAKVEAAGKFAILLLCLPLVQGLLGVAGEFFSI